MTTRWLIGLASGSTVDGVDSVLLETDGIGLALRVQKLQSAHLAYPRDLRELLVLLACATNCTARQMSLAHRLLGETFAAAARKAADAAGFPLQKAQVIGCAGHNLWHEAEGRFSSTLGLGMTAVVAERTGITTVSDFRSRDLAVGGQGLPLSALVDAMLFQHADETRLLLHLGGLASLVYLPAAGARRPVLGFQAGPCCGLLDLLMRSLTAGREGFDAGGKHAVQGKCIEELLQRWLAHPALQRKPPKSLMIQGFGEEFVTQAVQLAKQNQWGMHDLLCTATHFIVQGVTRAIKRFLPETPTRIILSGGGIRNGFLWHLLGQELEGTPLQRIDDHGIPAASRKAVASAGLAALTVDGVPANLPSATGASGSRLLGTLTPGSAANWARCWRGWRRGPAPMRGLATAGMYEGD